MGYLRKKRQVPDTHLEALIKLKGVADTELYKYNSTSVEGTHLKVKNPIIEERTFELAIVRGLYQFLNSTMPSLPHVSELKHTYLSQVKPTNLELFNQLKAENTFNDFFNLFYTNQLSECVSQEEYEHYKELYDRVVVSMPAKDMFHLKVKDSNGNIFLDTHSIPTHVLKDNYVIEFTLPMNDTTVTEKTGFNANEDIYAYLYFDYYDLEIPLNFYAENELREIDARYKFTWVVDEIRVDETYYYSINPNYSRYYLDNDYIY